MPCLGKPETLEQTARSPKGTQRRLGREGGTAPGLATTVLRCTGVPVSAEEKAQGNEASHIRSCGVGRGPSGVMLEPAPSCAPLVPV